MTGDRGAGEAQVLLGIGRAQGSRVGDRQRDGDVPVQRIVRCGLVGDEVEVLAATGELGHDLGRVSEKTDRQRTSPSGRIPDTRNRVVDRVRSLIEVARLQASLDP
jgi:hypothetical protein